MDARLDSRYRSSATLCIRSTESRRTVNLRLLSVSVLAGAVVGSCLLAWYRFQEKRIAMTVLVRASQLADEGEWSRAGAYLDQYLALQPDDRDVRLEMAEHYVRAATSPRARAKAVAILYQVVGYLPQHASTRANLARLLYEDGRFAAANTEARKTLRQLDEKNTTALRIEALSEYAQCHTRGADAVEKARLTFEKNLEAVPLDIEVVAGCAELYVRYASDLTELWSVANGPIHIDPIARADQIMDALVEGVPSDPLAWIARYRHHKRRKMPHSLADLTEALRVDPDSEEALYLRAIHHLESEDSAKLDVAKHDLEKLLERAPSTKAYLAMGRLHHLQGNSNEAIRILYEGERRVQQGVFKIRLAVAELLLATQQVTDAETLHATLSDELRDELDSLGLDAATQLEGRFRLFEAGLHIARGRFAQALTPIEIAKSLLSSLAERELIGKLLLKTSVLAAEAYAKMGALERSATCWSDIADQQERMEHLLFEDARLRAAQSYLRSGLFRDAIHHYGTFLKETPDEYDFILASVGLVQAHVAAELAKSPDEQSWSGSWEEFLQMRGVRVDSLPSHWALVMAEAQYAISADEDVGAKKAVQLLRDHESDYGDESDFWRSAALLYHNVGSHSGLDRALENLERIAASPIDVALLRSELHRRESHYEKADQVLAKGLMQLDGEDARAVEMQRIRIAVAASDIQGAQRKAVQLLLNHPRDTAIMIMAAELALATEDPAACFDLEERIRQVTGPRGFEWQQLRARRLLTTWDQLDHLERNELALLIAGLSAQRPRWHPILALAGQHAQRMGDTDRAIHYYQTAVERGDRKLETVERLVSLLYDDQRFSEANDVLRLVPSGSDRDRRLDALTLSIALQSQHASVSLQLAAEVASQHPDDPTRGLWHADLLFHFGRLKEAEQEYRRLIQRFPQSVQAWNGLFSHLVRTGRRNEAIQVLETSLESISLEGAPLDFVLGQWYEQLADLQAARTYYARAVGEEPSQLSYRHHLANLLLTIDVSEAKEQYEALLKQAPSDRDARRKLATLLASLGGEADWDRAERLLDGQTRNASREDRRAYAILLTRRGRTRQQRTSNCETARTLLFEMIQRSDGPAKDVDRILLAGVHEQLAMFRRDGTELENARSQLQHLVDRTDAPLHYQKLYLSFLLRHLSRGGLIGDGLSQFQSRRDSYLEDSRIRLADFQASIQTRREQESLTALQFSLRIMKVEGNEAAILPRVEEYAASLLEGIEDDTERAKIHFMIGNLYSSLRLHQRAESWYRPLAKLTLKGSIPLATSLAAQGKLAEAKQVSLQAIDSGGGKEVAAIVAQILAFATRSDREYEIVAPLIDKSLQDNRSDVGLLTAVAVMHARRGDSEKSLQYFQRIVAAEPGNVVALNNLATLLGERPGGRDQSLQYISRAIALVGRKPALLDTQGTIFLSNGDLDQAVACLEEASAGIVEDPRIHLHLAAAYQEVRRDGEARESLTKARRQGIDGKLLTAKDRELLQSLLQRFPVNFN